MKAKRVGALLLSAVLTVSLLSGCSSRSQVTEDMIPTVTDLQRRSGRGQRHRTFHEQVLCGGADPSGWR